MPKIRVSDKRKKSANRNRDKKGLKLSPVSWGSFNPYGLTMG
jgi:hypothetical protein